MRRYLTGVLAASLLVATAASAQTKLRLMSTDIRAGGKITNAHVFNGMDCKGDNISPELHWQGAPAGTKSFALTMYDPDAPTGSGWWHWVVYNIPAGTNRLAPGAGDSGKTLMPAGAVMGNGDMGQPSYVGPCPPKGDKTHHYTFTLFALNTDHLDVPLNASSAFIGFNIHMHQIAKATLTATYRR